MKKTNKIYLKKNSILYVLAPSNVSTGGPEGLHQLAYNCQNLFKVNTRMVYLPILRSNPVHKNYKNFKLKFAKNIKDDSDNVLIIPEQYFYLKYSLKFKNIKKIIWWLSLDNYLVHKFKDENSKYIRSIIKIPYNVINLFNKITSYYFGIFTFQDYLKFLFSSAKFKKYQEINQANLHVMQSYYAYEYFKKKLPNVKLLYDYQRKIIIKNYKKKIKKKDIVCYSDKSNNFIKLIKSYTKLNFIPLVRLNSNQIIDVFKKTKIYLDFGYHPGKDRMPREAALFDNCIIVNRKGSANNNIDIPINKKFKFNEKYSNLNDIKNTMNDVLKNYKKEILKFRHYKKKILEEEKVFKKQLFSIFKKI
jgi:hypothetical protein